MKRGAPMLWLIAGYIGWLIKERLKMTKYALVLIIFCSIPGLAQQSPPVAAKPDAVAVAPAPKPVPPPLSADDLKLYNKWKLATEMATEARLAIKVAEATSKAADEKVKEIATQLSPKFQPGYSYIEAENRFAESAPAKQ